MNVDTDTQYAFTRPIVDHIFKNYDGVLKIDGEVGVKKTYDPRTYGKIAEAMRSRPRRVQAHMLRASQLAPEREWRALLADDRWEVVAGAEVDRRTVQAARDRRARRRTTSLAAAVVLTGLTGVVVATVR